MQALMKAFRVEDLPIESKMLTRSLDEAQKKVESYFFDIRKQLFEYDEVLNSQRDRVYTERRRALEAKNLEAQMLEYAELTMDDILEVPAGPFSNCSLTGSLTSTLEEVVIFLRLHLKEIFIYCLCSFMK